MAFALTTRARLLLGPVNRQASLTARQTSRHAADRTFAPPHRALDVGLRRRPFPVHAADLLTGLLTVTRAGLSPAGSNEHVSGPVTSSRHHPFDFRTHVGSGAGAVRAVGGGASVPSRFPGGAQLHGHSSVRLQPLPHRTGREVLPHPAHRCPSPDGMQRSPQRGSCLGQPVQHVRRASNPTKWLLAPRGTHQSTPPATCTDKVGVLPITGGYVVRPAPAVLRPPPPPFRLAVHFPALTGYRTPRSDALSQGAGPGRASPVPVATFRTFHVPYAGRFLEAAFQDLHLVHGLRPDHPGSAPPWSCQ